MADSVGNYYSEWINLATLDPSATFLPIHLLHSSTKGAVSITTTLEGRVWNPISGAYETAFVIDSLTATSSTETMQQILTALAGKERPTDIRVKADGQAGNRSDTVLKIWVEVIK